MNKRSNRVAAAIARITEAAPALMPQAKPAPDQPMPAAPSLRHFVGALHQGVSGHASGEAIREIDTAVIDPSPYADRMQVGSGDDEGLAARIAQDGQIVPILLRPSPGRAGRYQIAYGHRRVRACQRLGRTVRAVVKTLSDVELAAAQARENIDRQDLTYFEISRFAFELLNKGHGRETLPVILGLDRTEVSRMLGIAATIPDEVAQILGRLEGVGRGRLSDIAEWIRQDPMLSERIVANAEDISNKDGQGRVTAVTNLRTGDRAAAEALRSEVSTIRSGKTTVAKITRAPNGATRLDIGHGDFARYLERQLSTLFDQFTAGQ